MLHFVLFALTAASGLFKHRDILSLRCFTALVCGLPFVAEKRQSAEQCAVLATPPTGYTYLAQFWDNEVSEGNLEACMPDCSALDDVVQVGELLSGSDHC